ncbi:MAG: hypothetical protein K2Y32_00375 [Candidatus Obscuribacterales bacterium]|nr:hypothetical protein [Candidatus Obscuribacterales bacterium]
MENEFASAVVVIFFLAASFWLGQAVGGSLAYNKALDDVGAFGYEAVDAYWDRQRPQFFVRDKELKPRDRK